MLCLRSLHNKHVNQQNNLENLQWERSNDVICGDFDVQDESDGKQDSEQSHDRFPKIRLAPTRAGSRESPALETLLFPRTVHADRRSGVAWKQRSKRNRGGWRFYSCLLWEMSPSSCIDLDSPRFGNVDGMAWQGKAASESAHVSFLCLLQLGNTHSLISGCFST